MDRYFDPNNLTAAKTRKLIQRNYFYHSLPYFYQSLEIQSEEKNEQFRGVFKLIPFSFESDAIFARGNQRIPRLSYERVIISSRQ